MRNEESDAPREASGPTPRIGASALRTLIVIYERGASAARRDLWAIAKSVAADVGGGESEAREALDILRSAGFLETTAGFDVGVLTTKGIQLAKRLSEDGTGLAADNQTDFRS